MARNRLYDSNADRQRAYRQRITAVRGAWPAGASPPAKRRRPPTRPARLAQVLAEVQALASDYEDWLAALPESLQASALADKLAETAEQLNQAADVLSEIDLPKGFGRD